MITNKFTDLDYSTGFGILKKYLILDNIFARIQKEAKTEFKKLDLNYIINHKVDDMYISKKNAGELEKPYKRDKERYIYASHIPNDTLMNEKFINQLDSKATYNQIFVSRFEIKAYISNLDLYSEALILKRIFPNVKLKIHNKKLAKFEKVIEQLSYVAHKNHLKKALECLYDLILLAENDSKIKDNIMSDLKAKDKV